MTITLDPVTAEMLKAIVQKVRKYDSKKYLSYKIKQIYMDLWKKKYSAKLLNLWKMTTT